MNNMNIKDLKKFSDAVDAYNAEQEELRLGMPWRDMQKVVHKYVDKTIINFYEWKAGKLDLDSK
jgi:hypothetical protein